MGNKDEEHRMGNEEQEGKHAGVMGTLILRFHVQF